MSDRPETLALTKKSGWVCKTCGEEIEFGQLGHIVNGIGPIHDHCGLPEFATIRGVRYRRVDCDSEAPE